MKLLFSHLHFMLFFWLIFVSNQALAGESHSIFRLTNGWPYTQIPFRFINNMIVLPVTLNGQQGFNFILDTGTRTPLVLNKKAIQLLELPRGRNISFSGAGLRGKVRGYAVNDIKIELPGIEAAGISMVVLEKNYLHIGKLNGVEIHGILGATLFRSLVVNIDYPHQVIYLIDKNAFHPCPAYASLAMQIIDSKPVVQAELHIENKSYHTNLMIDTGFNHELLLRPGTFALPASARYSRLGRGIGGLISGTTGKVDHLKLNTMVMQDVMALFPTAKSYPSDDHQMQHQGTMGNGLLKHYNIILDYAGETLYIKHSLMPVEAPANPFMAKGNVLERNVLSDDKDCYSNWKPPKA